MEEYVTVLIILCLKGYFLKLVWPYTALERQLLGLHLV